MTKPDLIYLDYNATALIKPEVIELMSEVMKEGGNPSSVHGLGRLAKARMEEARSIIAEQINCRPQMIIFTSGGTEANNMAVLTCDRTRLITTNVEHDSIRSASSRFKGGVDHLSVDQDGLIDLGVLKELLEENGSSAIISILFANNETGVMQDVKKISAIAHEAGALLHIDAIQALTKVPIDFMELGADMMSLSSHKTGGPQGVGALITYEKLPVKSFVMGGGQEIGRRGGTENIAGIAGFGKAVSLIPQSLEKMKELESWRDEIERKLFEYAPASKFLGQNAKRLPNVSTIYMPNVTSETQVMNFDLDKICISSGSACSSGKVKSSHVIDAMSNDANIATSTIRMSLGWGSEHSDVRAFIKSWKKQYDRKNS
ncbi:MAG: cysteine desulfurase [Kordiimonadaceae bacterium]|nr:cysteine desulfurase [Kordiimonadaceae bacterium]MBT6035232.1 cysteine desulfurase [Kordiimonadaceae bacterium]MBT6329121.1 cysteine desulfurase [Kordiimonadaceae bacterium]